MTKEIYLSADKQWMIEWKMSGVTGSIMLLCDDATSNNKVPFVYIRSNGFVGIGSLQEDTYYNYGFNLNNYGIDITSGIHTYKLINRLENDTNMIYLIVDNKEIGALTKKHEGSTTYLEESTWLSGQDFTFSFIGTTNALVNNVSLEYLNCYETYEEEEIIEEDKTSFKWELINNELISTGINNNTLTSLQGNISNNIFSKKQYSLENQIELKT